VQHVWIIGLALSLGVLQASHAFAVLTEPASASVERGYSHVEHARIEADSAARERLLRAALTAFKEAYQTESADPASKVQALLGATQALLLAQAPRRVFPFLWQATPLQRAERNLQQALVLQPHNAAAVLLLGVVYWRQAAQTTGKPQDLLAQSHSYLVQAARLGVPLHLAASPLLSAATATPFHVEDTIIALRYIDAQGEGRLDDLLFVYQRAASTPIFGAVIIQGRAYPLTTDTTTGALVSHGMVEASTVIPQSGASPVLVMRLRQEKQVLEQRFAWDGTHVVALPRLP
jgi:hypothetical protein